MSKYITKTIGEYTISFSMEDPTLIFKNCKCKSDNQKITIGEASAFLAQTWINELFEFLENLFNKNGQDLDYKLVFKKCAKILRNCLKENFDDHRPFNSSFDVEINQKGLKLKPADSSAVVSIKITGPDFKEIHDLFVRTLRGELVGQVRR